MKTRINKTERIKNGVQEVVYQAQYHNWEHLTYKPIIDYYVSEDEYMDCTPFYKNWWWTEDFKPSYKRGTLEFCKELIDFVLLQESMKKNGLVRKRLKKNHEK